MKRVDAALVAAEVMAGALEAETKAEAGERARLELEVLSRDDLLLVAQVLVSETVWVYLPPRTRWLTHQRVGLRRTALVVDGDRL